MEESYIVIRCPHCGERGLGILLDGYLTIHCSDCGEESKDEDFKRVIEDVSRFLSALERFRELMNPVDS